RSFPSCSHLLPHARVPALCAPRARRQGQRTRSWWVFRRGGSCAPNEIRINVRDITKNLGRVRPYVLLGEQKGRGSTPLPNGAGDETRTRTTSLEGWGSTIELRPHGTGDPDFPLDSWSRLGTRVQCPEQWSHTRSGDAILGVRRTGCSAAWLARMLWEHEVAGSSPATPTEPTVVARPFSAARHGPLRTWPRLGAISRKP